MISRIACLLLLYAVPLSGQIGPELDPQNPRIQTVEWEAGQPVVLTTLPRTSLLVLLHPSEQISQTWVSTEAEWNVLLSEEGNSFFLTPKKAGASGILEVKTAHRLYVFKLRTSQSLDAALVVRFVQPDQRRDNVNTGRLFQQQRPDQTWHYRIRGDRSVRPISVWDDGRRTMVRFEPDQPLPAVFAIGATGEEEIVNGYMRGEVFEIDRVYEELVFRINRERAKAQRNSKPEDAS